MRFAISRLLIGRSSSSENSSSSYKEEYVLYHFSEKLDNKSIDFDFKLKEGKLRNRNAIRILQINDYPDEIIVEAIEISKELDNITM